MPARYDLSQPVNQRKLEAADALGRLAESAGMSLVHLAIAFVIPRPSRPRRAAAEHPRILDT